jgi:hypothetical protein
MKSDRDSPADFAPDGFNPGEKLDPVVLGQSLLEAGLDEFEGEAGRVRASWHRSSLGAELLLWRSAEGLLLQAQLNVRGEIAQWDPAHGARTGLVVEADVAPGALEETVRFDVSAVRAALERAAIVVRAVESLDLAEREALAARYLALPAGEAQDRRPPPALDQGIGFLARPAGLMPRPRRQPRNARSRMASLAARFQRGLRRFFGRLWLRLRGRR